MARSGRSRRPDTPEDSGEEERAATTTHGKVRVRWLVDVRDLRYKSGEVYELDEQDALGWEAVGYVERVR